MTSAILSFLAGTVVGGIVVWAAARREIAKIKRDDLPFQLAPTIEHHIRFWDGR